MTINVIASNKIQITDFRPRTDTLYTHTGEFNITDNILDLHEAQDMTGRRKVIIDGVTYIMGSVADLTSVPYTRDCLSLNNSGAGTGVISNNSSHMFTKQFSLIVRYKWQPQWHTSSTPISFLSKGTNSALDWELGCVITSDKQIYFNDNPTELDTGTRVLSGLYINPEEWTFVAVTVDGTDITFYQDENTSTATSSVGNRTNSTNDIWIGKDYLANNPIGGYIDEIQIYDRVIPPAVMESIRVNHSYLTDAIGIYRFNTDPVSLTIPDEATDRRLLL